MKIKKRLSQRKRLFSVFGNYFSKNSPPQKFPDRAPHPNAVNLFFHFTYFHHTTHDFLTPPPQPHERKKCSCSRQNRATINPAPLPGRHHSIPHNDKPFFSIRQGGKQGHPVRRPAKSALESYLREFFNKTRQKLQSSIPCSLASAVMQTSRTASSSPRDVVFTARSKSWTSPHFDVV